MLSDIKNKIREIIADEVGLELDQIGDDTLLLSDGILDSFALIAVLVAIEAAIGVTVAQDDLTLDNFDSLNRIEAFIARQ